MLLAVGHCLAMIDRNLLAVAATPVARALGLHDGMLGLLLGAALAVPYAMAAVPLGRLGDLGWRRALLIGGVGLWTLAAVAIGLAHSGEQLIAARIAMGLGQAAFVPAALALLVGGAASPRRLALFTGSSTLGRNLALLGGGLGLAGLATAGVGEEWRWLFVLTALPNLLLIVMLLREPALGALVPTGQAMTASIAPPWRQAIFLAAACAPIVFAQATIAWMPTLLVRLQGLSPAQGGMLVGGVALVVGPASQLLAGWLAQRVAVYRERPLLAIAAGLWLAIPALLLVVRADTLPATALGIAGVNLALGLASFAAIFGWQGLLPAHARGLGNGAFMATVTLVGVGAGPLLAGLLSEQAGGGGAALATALLTTGGLAASLASVAALASVGWHRQRRAVPA